MTNPNYTEIAVIIDKSGSMTSLIDETISGYNEFISSQKDQPGHTRLTLCLFSDEHYMLYEGMDIKEVPDLSKATYKPTGSTAIHDAIGHTIASLGNRLKGLEEHQRPGKVIVCIITDGMENASRQFSKVDTQIKIEHQQEVYSWEFVFLGADPRAVKESRDWGIRGSHSAYYRDAKRSYHALRSAVVGIRKGNIEDVDWKSETGDHRNLENSFHKAPSHYEDPVHQGDPGDESVKKNEPPSKDVSSD